MDIRLPKDILEDVKNGKIFACEYPTLAAYHTAMSKRHES